jgi:phosphatase NudJ
MSKSIETWCFALVVVRLGHRFLVVRERKHGGGWYLPAGRVEAGETFAEAAIRETREEAGIEVALDGILRVEHSPSPDGTARQRVLFVARPVDDTPPKSEPDDESMGAAWVTLDELDALSLRGAEIVDLFRAVAEGAQMHPLSLLVLEGAPFRASRHS